MGDSVPQFNELVKQGGGTTGSSLIGSKLLVDSAKHLSQVNRLTLDSGISLSCYGLDLAYQGSIQNAKEIFVETLHVKHLDVAAGSAPTANIIPDAAPLPMAIELPDDMMLESLQINNTLQLVPFGGGCGGGTGSSSSLLKTDASGTVVPAPASLPNTYLTADHQNQLQWLPIVIPAPVTSPPPPPPITSTPLPDNLARVQVAIPDHIPRFTGDTHQPTLSSTSVKIDEADNVTGVNKLETLELSVAESCQVDQMQAAVVRAPVIHTQKLNVGGAACTVVYETNMYVSNGPFQNIGFSGEGAYVFNLKIEDNTFSLYGTFAIGKTKVAFRTSFGAALGGVKSTQLEEHESEQGFDYVVAVLPDLGKIYLGVEQKTAEIVVKTDQEQLVNMDIYVQKTHMVWNRKTSS